MNDEPLSLLAFVGMFVLSIERMWRGWLAQREKRLNGGHVLTAKTVAAKLTAHIEAFETFSENDEKWKRRQDEIDDGFRSEFRALHKCVGRLEGRVEGSPRGGP